MSTQINFTVGNGQSGYKTAEIVIRGDKCTAKILRGGLLNVGKKIRNAEISEAQLAELDALNIFSWAENYSADTIDGAQWQLTFKVGKKIHHVSGSNACPENFEQFLDWLDVFFPELEFVDRKRLERMKIECGDERLTLDRRELSLTLYKKNSTHVYYLSDDKKIFDSAQKFVDGLDRMDSDINFSTLAKFEFTRHDKTVETFATRFNENFLPGLSKFLNAVQSVAFDLTADIFNAETAEVTPRQGKYIFCKVQFKGNYKAYTYRTDDETLAVGDIVDVPVGRNNDVTQARISDIAYYDEYETPQPVDKIKKIIGKHIGTAWEN